MASIQNVTTPMDQLIEDGVVPKMSNLPNVICRLVNLDVLVGNNAVYVYPPLGRIVGHPTIIL